MSSSVRTMLNDTENSCVKVLNDNFTIEWIIEDVKLLPQGNAETIYSPDFYTVNKEVTCHLSLSPQTRVGDNEGYVDIRLHLNSEITGPIKMRVHADLVILPSGMMRKLEFLYEYENSSACGGSKSIKKSELLEACRPEDRLTIRCKINISWRPTDRTKCTEEDFDCREGQWSQDFQRLCKGSKFSDVVVIVGKERIPAHKLVLAARSPIFSAMFEHEKMPENRTNEVKIEAMEPAVVKAMLDFFYTDEVENLEGLACGLLGAAEKYDIPQLRSMCEKYLFRTLNKENAAEILIHTDLYRSPKLKEHVLKFMADHLSDVLESVCYKEMEEKYPALVNELVRSMAIRQKSKKRKMTT